MRTIVNDDGSVGQKMESLLGKLQPEAAYFGPVDGKRGGFIVIKSRWPGF